MPPQAPPSTRASFEDAVLRALRTVSDQVLDLNVTQRRLDERLDSFEGRLLRNSSHAKAPSKEIEALSKKVADLETKLDANTKATEEIRTAVVGVITNPKVRLAGNIIVKLLVGLAIAKGIHVL
jgi:chromosome segregation ATPase